MYKVEKLKFEIENGFLCSLDLLIASVTGLLFHTTQTFLTLVKDLHLLLFICICLKYQRKLILLL